MLSYPVSTNSLKTLEVDDVSESKRVMRKREGRKFYSAVIKRLE